MFKNHTQNKQFAEHSDFMHDLHNFYQMRFLSSNFELAKKIHKSYLLRRLSACFRESLGEFNLRLLDHEIGDEYVLKWLVEFFQNVLGFQDCVILDKGNAEVSATTISLGSRNHSYMIVYCVHHTVSRPLFPNAKVIQSARDIGAAWVCTTNFKNWSLSRIQPSSEGGSDVQLIFDIDLTNYRKITSEDAELFFLLTRRSILSGDTERLFHKHRCLSADFIVQALNDPAIDRVLSRRICEIYWKQTGVEVLLEPGAAGEAAIRKIV